MRRLRFSARDRPRHPIRLRHAVRMLWRQVAEVSPFYAMSGLPAEIAAYGGPVGGALVLQLFWLVVLLVAVRFLWRAGVRRYTAVGS